MTGTTRKTVSGDVPGGILRQYGSRLVTTFIRRAASIPALAGGSGGYWTPGRIRRFFRLCRLLRRSLFPLAVNPVCLFDTFPVIDAATPAGLRQATIIADL